jgi:hypothetical protein
VATIVHVGATEGRPVVQVSIRGRGFTLVHGQRVRIGSDWTQATLGGPPPFNPPFPFCYKSQAELSTSMTWGDGRFFFIPLPNSVQGAHGSSIDSNSLACKCAHRPPAAARALLAIASSPCRH